MGEGAREFRTAAGARLGTLGALYVAQGITWGLVSGLLLPWFAAKGVSLADQAGIFVLGTVPWALKVAWAPLLDRFGGVGSGNQRRWIVIGQSLMALSVLAMGVVDDPFSHPTQIGALWFVHNLFMSLQDVATDALAVDVLREDERGRANSFMLGGHALGVFLGSFVLGKLSGSLGLSGIFMLDAGVVLALAPVVLLIRREDLAEGPAQPVSFLAGARLAFSRPAARIAIAVSAVVLVADSALSAVAQNFLVVELEHPMERLYGELVPVDIAAQLVGFAATAAIIERVGHRRLAVVGAVGMALVWASFVGAQGLWPSFGFILAFTVAQALCTTPFKAGLHAFLMDLTDPAVRATQFAVFMAALNLGRSVGGSVAPSLVESLGYSGLFLGAAAVQVGVALVLALAGRRAT